jgi:hypothetical protein
MSAARHAARHAGTLYRRTLTRVRRPVRAIESEVEHLREVEREGKSAETPFVAILGIVLFLLPIVAIVLGLAFAAYYLAR